MFEKATRQKLRFSYKGNISVEDLWDLSVNELDKIYGKLRKEQKTSNDDSLLQIRTKEATVLNLKTDIVKHVVQVKLQEAEARKNRAENKMQRDKIASIIQEKQDEGLKNMSVEELRKTMDELGQ